VAQRVGGPWHTVKKLIELFVSMGCELGELPGRIEDDQGTRRIRFLYSPESDDFVSLSDLDDDERIPPTEVENWERRLGITIPKGDNRS
jgi:hypothetical protein